MEWRDRKLKLYLEAGLALLTVLVLGIAGIAGLLSAGAEERGTGPVSVSAAGSGKAGTAGEEKESASPGSPADGAEGSGGDSAEGSAGNGAEGSAGDGAAGGQSPIMGGSEATAQDLADYFLASGKPYPAEELGAGGADSLETFCRMYLEEAEAEGVRAEVAFAQTMKETGFLQYGGDAQITQFNFAGLGTTGGGVPGNSYPDVRTGIRAQIQHLKAYATADPLEQECVDDRYEYVKKGAAPYVEWLGQQENPEGLGWATAENYGYDIADMIEDRY